MKLHLGCWNRVIPGFVNVDLCDLPHIHYRRDIKDLSFQKDGSVDLIYSSHSLEYFDLIEVDEVLKEWRRVLKTNGTLRLAVPDFESLIEVYRKTQNLKDILGPLYGRMEIETDQAAKKKSWLYHKTVYDFTLMKKVLEKNGFGHVRRYNWQDTIHKNYDDHSQAYFPHMDKDNGILVSLNIEATKR
jgi:predicted SAM-dependent methyltransferase